ncbi:hypothetical protein GCM10009641_04010 [Mycobacterium cookii]|uniref:Uncharacterized protein n=1 Tax=Mycobacterium cookii TaxID=1775 RepID=A0A7I7L348_9MYCO|nr:hypothetical protein MCOO_45680 [Mycobacterium cookii]
MYDGKQCQAVVWPDVADADVLEIDPKVGPSHGVFVKDSQETHRAAAELDVGPAGKTKTAA